MIIAIALCVKNITIKIFISVENKSQSFRVHESRLWVLIELKKHSDLINRQSTFYSDSNLINNFHFCALNIDNFVPLNIINTILSTRKILVWSFDSNNQNRNNETDKTNIKSSEIQRKAVASYRNWFKVNGS